MRFDDDMHLRVAEKLEAILLAYPDLLSDLPEKALHDVVVNNALPLAKVIKESSKSTLASSLGLKAGDSYRAQARH